MLPRILGSECPQLQRQPGREAGYNDHDLEICEVTKVDGAQLPLINAKKTGVQSGQRLAEENQNSRRQAQNHRVHNGAPTKESRQLLNSHLGPAMMEIDTLRS